MEYQKIIKLLDNTRNQLSKNLSLKNGDISGAINSNS